MRGNLAKARRVLARISRVLRAENASARVCGIFYKATVHSVLLFGSDTWVLSIATLKRLKGYHVKAARRMTGLLPKKVGGHQATKTCKAMHAVRLQRKAVSDSTLAMDAKFYLYREELERVEVFE